MWMKGLLLIQTRTRSCSIFTWRNLSQQLPNIKFSKLKMINHLRRLISIKQQMKQLYWRKNTISKTIMQWATSMTKMILSFIKLYYALETLALRIGLQNQGKHFTRVSLADSILNWHNSHMKETKNQWVQCYFILTTIQNSFISLMAMQNVFSTSSKFTRRFITLPLKNQIKTCMKNTTSI